jgi:hypothetical protein
MRQKQEASALENETVSWWSWRHLFSLLCFFFRQIPRLVRQDIWKMRQEMPEKGRIFDTPQVYLLLRGKRHAISARQKR